ncbi:mucin-5AC-like isoform X2 [Penaeus japonicus]|uniref:mucin-5AC-like isoform X2 n=1 Tax=Penaeus japonicus TaxID=27405 RepID=UPI001C70BA5E|nr:mucin-5AC-like isoform X2 [Penaeus japonicus]
MSLDTHKEMKSLVRWAALACLLVLLCCNPGTCQHPTLPILDMDNLPATNFTCKEKVIGGYYADVYTGCQMFHVCTLDEKGEIHDYKFRCLMGTVFDQETRVCERADDVDCTKSESFFHLNNELYGPGIIPSTADTSDTSSAATVQVLDPTHALMGAPDPSSDLTGTSEAPSPSPTPPSLPPPAPPGPSSSPSEPQASPQTQSQSQPPPQPLPLPLPTSSPPPPVIPPGVTASSTRMSTSTSSSVTAAYSFPPLPFTVSRTSTSVSASSRVHIQTPLAQISLRQGVDPSALPAPHLRPSLLRLAAQAQNTGQSHQFFEALEPTSPSPVTAQTPRDFEDIPRLTRFQTDGASAPPPPTFANFDDSSHRQKRQTTTQGLAFSSSLPVQDETLPTESVAAPSPAQRNRGQGVNSSSQRVSSRGRVRFRQANPSSEPLTNRQTSRSNQRNRSRASSAAETRQRVTPNTRTFLNRPVQNNDNLRSRTEAVSQLEETTFARQQEAPVTRDTPVAVRQRVSVTPRPQNTRAGQRVQVVRRRPVPQPSAQEPEVDSQQDFVAEGRLSQTEDPTRVPPTVMTTALPSDSNIKVSDRILDATRISELSNAAPSTTTPPPVVFPETSFSCHDKIPGGLYADVEAGCVVFHICSVEPDSSTKDNKFVCGAGTLFDQTTRTCQAADKVDCARSPSLYYLNDPLRGPVFLELEAQLPEQQFDFPRIPIPDSQNSRRVKRDEDEAVDLCRTRPLGSPLADLTSQCRNYTVCEARGDGGGGGLVERRLPCKKDFLFSQLRRRCVPEKKVNCAKETLGEILGLGGVRSSSSGTSRRKRAASLLLSHRFRRAALPPLANLVRTHGIEDARGRRALYSLAALQQWAQENARHTAFINVYTLNTRGKEGSFAKKSLVDGGADPYASQEESHNYGYISRSKRDVNGTQIEEPATSDAFGSPADAHHEAKVEPVSETTGHSIAVVAPKTTVVRHPSVHKSVVLPVTSTVSSTVPSLLTTLSTLTITGASTPTSKTTTSTTTVTVTPFTVTVTTTETKIVPTETSLLAGQSSASPTSTAAPSLTAESSPLPTVSLSPTVESIVNSAVTESIRIDSSSPSETKPEAVTPVTEASSSVQSVPQEANINQEATTTVAPEAQNSTTPAASTTTETSTLSTTAGSTTVSSSTASSTVEPAVNIKAESTTVTSSAESSVVNSTIESTTIASSTESTVVKEEAAPDTITESSTTTSTTTPSTTTSASTPETTVSTVSTTSTSPPEVTKSALEDAPSANATATTGQPADFVFPEGSINVSTTVVPGEEDTLSNGTLVQPTPAPPTLGTFTRDNLPETNFTCKDKQLEQFYPDPEANCQVFHYCSPGFVKQQVLDLKFLCTGATMFDINTQKCEDSANVTCKYTEIDTKPPQPADPPTTTTEEPAPPTDIPVTTTSSTTTTASTTTSTTTEAPKNTTEAAPTTTTGAPVNTTEAPHDGHHNWNATKTEVESAGDKSDVASTTLETEVREVTEVALPETETVTDRAAREEVSTSTEGLEDAETTTEYFLVQEPEINTELGPIALPSSSTEELPVESLENPEGSETPVSTSVPGTESPTEASTLESISPQTPAPTEAAPPTEAPTVSEVSEGNIVSIATNASDSNHTAATSGEVAL